MSARPGPDPRPARQQGFDDRFRRMAGCAPVMIWVADPQGRFVYFNRHWLDFTGRPLESELGSGWIEGIHPEDRERCVAEHAQAFALSRPFEIEYRLLRGDGEYRWLLDKAVPVVVDGLSGFVGSCLDVDDHRRMEEKSAALLAHERNARANAETATLARDQFLAMVSHELRSPLNGIKSWTHVLESQMRGADPAVHKALAGIMTGVDQQVRLIDDLLDMTRAMSGNLGLAKRPMPLVEVLGDAVEGLRAMALEKDLAVVTHYGIGELEIHGDPDRVRQIFVNLMMNAIKLTPAGGRIQVSATAEGPMACIEVRDNGAGIPAELLPHAFDRELGLALAQRLAELHGGRVTCESGGANRGASFRVYLPASLARGMRT